ncbi:hypothetical protein [Cryobacterium gelidum]|uniref:Uncharacterized protein n=1 Tax=Cryobacterium gelidum TaxID=1259164 RepID=A0A4R9ATE7_9MICO|nr:hypothetical protein [Cryobacterium gelidum]TFD69678.1 hypothetical protein E3T50_11960 [Cryobacterium gelidum]
MTIHFLVGRGTVLAGFLDAQVHLALIDPTHLPGGGIARVLDLGGWLPDGPRASMPDLAYAHQFITAPGGYPSRARWAAPGWSCELTTAADAATAVDRQCRAGASVLKVKLNSVAGPVLAVEALAAAVGRAHERALTRSEREVLA